MLSVQFSLDSRYILTSVTHGLYQELILWDLPNFRYLRNEVTQAADKIAWFDSICSGSEDVRAIWENANLASANSDYNLTKPARMNIKRKSIGGSEYTNSTQSIVNLSCHRLVRSNRQIKRLEGQQQENGIPEDDMDLVIASDIRGYLRLFRYPCYDIQQGFYEIRVSSSAVNCCRFLTNLVTNEDRVMFVSTTLDGSICLWALDRD